MGRAKSPNIDALSSYATVAYNGFALIKRRYYYGRCYIVFH